MRGSLFGAALCLSSSPALSQKTPLTGVVNGTVVQRDGTTPASSVIVLLLSEQRDSVLARTTTGGNGGFLLRAATTRPVWIELLRLGQRPQFDGPHRLAESTDAPVRITLTDAPVQLATVAVSDKNACTVRPDSGLLVAQLYEEARKTLLASSIAADAANISARFSTFTRTEDVRGRQLAPIERITIERETSRPFTSLSPDSLARSGYVSALDDGTIYRAPDANVLLSESFVRTHCFRLVNGTHDRADFVGVGFEPVRTKDRSSKNRVDIRGVMWLHRAQHVLESVEFGYEPLAAELTRARVGGTVEFAQTPSALWFVKRWELRMPRMVKKRVASGLTGPIPSDATTLALDGLDVTGGEVESLHAGSALLYALDPNAKLTTTALALDGDTGGRDAAGAVPANALETATSNASSGATAVTSAGACRINADTAGSIRGRITDQTNFGVGDVRVTATYKEQFRAVGNTGFTWRNRTLVTESALGGTYLFCGVPLATLVTIEATPANAKSAAGRQVVTLTPEARDAERDVRVTITTAEAAFGAPNAAASTEADTMYVDVLPMRLQEFDKRAASGASGTFVTRADILRHESGSLLQIIRGVGGVSIVDSAGVRRAMSTRGRVMTRGAVKQCVFPVVVDNITLNGLESLDAIRPRNVYGIEVYFGPATIPHSLAALTRESWCGLIAVWTMEN